MVIKSNTKDPCGDQTTLYLNYGGYNMNLHM